MKNCFNKRIVIGCLACFGGFLIHLVIGSVYEIFISYQWGIISIYITSYFKQVDNPQLSYNETSIVFPIVYFTIGIMMYLGCLLRQKFGIIIVLILTESIKVILIFSSSYIKIFGLFVFVYGIMFGLCSGISFMLTLNQCNKYFVDKVFYVNGFILMGSGLGSLVWGQFTYHYINPYHVKPINGYYIDQVEYIVNNVTSSLRFLSLFYLITSGIGLSLIYPCYKINKQNDLKIMQQQNLFLKQKEKNIEQNNSENKKEQLIIKADQSDINSQNSLQVNAPQKKNQKMQCKSIKDAITTLFFLKFPIIIILVGNYPLMMNSIYKIWGINFISDDSYLTMIGSIAAIGNGCTRFLWNILYHKIGVNKLYIIICFINIFSCIMVSFFTHIKQLYTFLVFLSSSCIGGTLGTAPTYARITYGAKVGGQIYGLYWTCFAISNFVQFAVVSFLKQHVGFNNIFYISLGTNILAIILLLFFNLQINWQEHYSKIKKSEHNQNLDFNESNEIYENNKNQEQEIKNEDKIISQKT